MANINLMLGDNLKKDFKCATAQERKQMSEVLRDFIAKFNASPEVAIQFLYSTQS